eukprot:jgi/Psemu1/37197/gm1.37197_g
MDTSNLQRDTFPSFDQPLATIMRELFDVSKESDSILCDTLKNSTIHTWQQFILLRDFEALTYHDCIEYKQLPRYVHQELHVFLAFGDHLKDQGKDPTDHNLYTKEVFEDYSYSVLASVPDSTVNPKSSDQLRYEYWTQISRNATTFPVLHNDTQFEHWLVKFKSQLGANGINTTTFLDPDWPDTALTGYPKALHDKQCAFFWTLLRHVFQGDFSSPCVLNHQWTRNGCQAYFDFVTFHNPVSYPAPVPVQPSADVLVTPPLPDDLKSLFPSFDSELAYILHTTLHDPQEAHNHLCEALISAHITSFDNFVTSLASPVYVAYLEYPGQDGWQSISLDDQRTLNTFIDLVFLVNSQDTGEWYDISQYNRTVFLDLCNTRARSPGLAATQNRATSKIPVSQPPRESADVCTITSTPAPVPVRPPSVGNIVMPPPTPVSPSTPVPITGSPPTARHSPPCLAANKTPVHPTVDNPAIPHGLPGSSNHGSADDSTSNGTPTYTWKYFHSTDSVRFSSIASSSTPSIVHTDIPTECVPSKCNREPLSTRDCPSSPPPANSRWTFYPHSETVAFHRTRKPVYFPQATCIPFLQLPPPGASTKDSVVSRSVHTYSQHGAPSCSVPKPLYGAHHTNDPVWKPLHRAHSMPYDSPAVCITKRHRDAIKLKLYHLHANLLFADWFYDNVA